MRYLSALLLLIVMLVPQSAYADIHPGDSELQGWCITGPDPRKGSDPTFEHAVTGYVSGGALENDPKHIHLDDLIKDGQLTSVEETYGRSFIFAGYWVADGHQTHLHAYLPKSDRALLEVPCYVALGITGDSQDGYLDVAPGGDKEQKRQNGMDGEGQTQSDKGKERGAE
jgi:hypothetical protein